MSDFKCSSCEFCGREVSAKLMCSVILNDEDKKEKACWCVCKDCMGNFKENIKNYYKEIINDKPKRKKAVGC